MCIKVSRSTELEVLGTRKLEDSIVGSVTQALEGPGVVSYDLQTLRSSDGLRGHPWSTSTRIPFTNGSGDKLVNAKLSGQQDLLIK